MPLPTPAPPRAVALSVLAAAMNLWAAGAPAASLSISGFTDSDGALCDLERAIELATTSKSTADGFLAGTRFALLLAQCTRPGESPQQRSYLLSYPPGSNFADPANGRVRIPKIDPESAAAVVAIRFLVDPFVVGLAETSNPAFFDPYHAFRHEVGGSSTQDLGSLAGADGTSAAYGGASDGSVVVGTSTVNNALNPDPIHAFRWTPALGMQDLGAMIPGGSSDARAASADGSVVVGSTFVAPGVQEAFRWTLDNAATGAGSMVSLGPATRIALAVTGDGTTVVGKGANDRAFRWTPAGGVQDLGTLAGLAQAQATSVADDGQVVVGVADNLVVVNFPLPLPPTPTQRAFRWTPAGGMQYLGDLLTAAGVDLTGVTLLDAASVSADGTVISGTALLDGSSDPVAYAVRYRDATNGSVVPSATLLSFATLGTPGLQLGIGPASGSIASGASVETQLDLEFTGGFSGTVTFRCENLPAFARCTFAPASLAASGTSALAIATRGGLAAAAFGGLFLALLALPGRRGRRVALPVLAAATLLSCGGDGGGGPTTPPGTYAIDVVATGGSGEAARATYTLTVR